MKKHWIISAALAFSLPVVAEQSTNETRHPKGDRYGEHKKGDRGGRGDRMGKEHRELSPEQKEQMQERRLQLMDKTLKNIGVTEEQKQQIFAMQQVQREQMKASFHKIEESKRKLAELQRSGASEEAIYAAIDAVSDAQGEQMKILARSRMQMERILGPDKYQLFMESARSKWREHGRRGGSGMPPRPGLPPIPSGQQGKNPPLPSQAPPVP